MLQAQRNHRLMCFTHRTRMRMFLIQIGKARIYYLFRQRLSLARDIQNTHFLKQYK